MAEEKVKLTPEQLKAKLVMQYVTNIKWATNELTTEEKQQIEARCKELSTGRNPFLINYSNNIKVVKDAAGNPVLDAQGKKTFEGKLFELRGSVFSSSISNPEILPKKDGSGSFVIRELKFTVIPDDYKLAAKLIYSTVVSWKLANNKEKLAADDLYQCFDGKNYFWVNQRVDKETKQPVEGYWVNFSMPVKVSVDNPNNNFQICGFRSAVQGKTLTAQNADEVLKPTANNKAFISISMDVHMNQNKNNRCEFRAQTVRLINSPFQSNSISADELLDFANGDYGADAPAPAEPVQPAPVNVVPVQQAVTPQINPIDEIQMEPSEEDIMAALGMTEL